jgi:hypothetical protein
MSLKGLQEGFALDQNNIQAGRVTSISDGTVHVRTRDGKVLRAAGSGYQTGDQVLLHTDGRSYTVAGTAPLAAIDGESIERV